MAVHCEGFKSRIWATGFDISDHAVLSSIVQPPKQKRKMKKQRRNPPKAQNLRRLNMRRKSTA